MKNKISRIDIVSFQTGIRRVTVWRRQPCGIDSPTNYIAATAENSVTESSMIRAQRAQRALAGMMVDGWPFSVGLCECKYPHFTHADDKHCQACGKRFAP